MSTPSKEEAERPAKLSLGEFLLAAQWVDFPGLGKDFVFAFPSARARSDFWRKWKGVTVVLPGGKEVTLTRSTNSTKGTAFLLTCQTSVNEEAIRKYIKRKLQGMGGGHTVAGLWQCAHGKYGVDCTKADVRAVAEQMIKEGILRRNPTGGRNHRLYQFADDDLRLYSSQLEDSMVGWDEPDED